MTRNRRLGTRTRRVWLHMLISLLFTIGLLLPGSTAGADDPIPTPTPGEPTQLRIAEALSDVREVEGPSKSNPKLGSSLVQLLDVYRREGMAGVQAFAKTPMTMLDGNRVQVVVVTAQGAISTLKRAIDALGGEYQTHYETLLQAWVPIGALESLAGRADVQFVREPQRPIPLAPVQVGSETTEGVAASNASAWHTAGYDGAGVRIAVIDLGFTGYSGLLGTDLPASVGTHNWTGGGMGGTKHGTACAEIVYDMAYGATMDLHKVSTEVELGNAVSQAISDGVDVISMSLGWTINGPGDGTGSLANIVNNARSNGIFYATAAGNDAQVSWSGTYVDSGTSDYHAWDGSTLWYNFLGPGGTTCYVFPSGTLVRAGLHWDDWTAVNQDYDLHLYRYPGGSSIYRVASSTNPQNGGAGQTPEEFVYTTASGSDCYAFVVERDRATRDVCLRLLAPKMVHLDEWVTQRSLTFPADSPDAITVGAVDVGSSSYPLESYSSRGPTFGSGGACSGGSTKPDIAAYANVSTVSYGAGLFDGTSAATPHVAGAAALVKEAYPGYSVTQLQNYLENEAMDLGATGKDNLYGSGRLYLGGVAGAPTISGLPGQSLRVDTSLDNAIDLWAYTSDPESPDSALTFSIDNTPDTNAGVSIDSNRYIDINPVSGWAGQTDVVIRATDPGGLSDTDSFRVTVIAVASLPFCDGFESGILSTSWMTDTTDEGRVRVSSSYPHSGTYSVLLDDRLSNTTYSQAAIVLTIDLSGRSDVDLDFWWRDFGDEDHADDGVFVSDDWGTTWFTATNFTGSQSSFKNEVIDLDAAATANGLTLNDHFQVKFQFYDNFPITLDGYAIDDVCFNTSPAISGLPDQALSPNTSRDDAIDLWAYASDAESPDSALTFSIDNTPDANAGVSLDSNRYIDINPASDWTGETDVVIRVTDSGVLSDTDSFRVTVGQLLVYLPIVLCNH